MTYANLMDRRSLIDNVIAKVGHKLGKKKADIFATYLQRYFGTASATDLYEKSIDELCIVAMQNFQFVATREPQEVHLRVVNLPGIPYTVIEVNCQDMPFLVDSIRMELNREGLLVHFIIHMGSLLIERNAKHEMTRVYPVGVYPDSTISAKNEAVIYIEIDRQENPVFLGELETSLRRVLEDVRLAVEDWGLMREQLRQSLIELDASPLSLNALEIAESKDFLRWLESDHFTFLGYREYELVGKGDARAFRLLPGSSLGVLRDESKAHVARYFSDMPEEIRRQVLSPQILRIAKTNTHSTVHRPVYTDYIGIKRFNAKGEMIGERRFVGLYTSAAYSMNPKHIPFLRHKVATVMQQSLLPPFGHSGKALLSILEDFPRDDLFQATPEELLEISLGILYLQERQRIRLFVRKDANGRSYSCLLYLPKERVNTTLENTLKHILQETFSSDDISSSTQITDSILARIHFTVHVSRPSSVELDVPALEKKLIAASRVWEDIFYDNLISLYGEVEGVRYFNRYRFAFPEGYKEYYGHETASCDVAFIERLSEENPLQIVFYRSRFKEHDVLRLKLFHLKSTMPLSDVLPILENMALRVQAERPNEVVFPDGNNVWINDFDLVYTGDTTIDVEAIKNNFQETFSAVWEGKAENDGFNRLVLRAGMSCRQTSLLRAYAKYLQQIRFSLSQPYIEATLSKQAVLANLLVELFDSRFHPEKAGQHTAKVLKKIDKEFDAVVALDEDRILRKYVELIRATIRTNFYQLTADGLPKESIALKFSPDRIADLPLPKPLYEVFVYAPFVEGIHLRSAKVARGGLRWTERRDDFRTEVLGLMKAQSVKNSVIVPAGAKGGFYPKRLPAELGDAYFEEGKRCYRTFIRGLLDLVDNVKQGVIVRHANTVIYDEDDTYLVVAADKGTATFSDIANAISKEYEFWLGDAFASGGSAGYDHKKIGITARGAFESVKRNFKEVFNRNVLREEFTVVGIGDMSGDVFGNGMLLSEHIRLVAAFNHAHIFLDPKPEADKSFLERKRLFDLPRSSWADYDATLISKGGGVYKRSEKFIKLSPEVKKLLNLRKDYAEPNELIKAILCAEVDLLWNGGIGTYVKSERETDLEVGDRFNDAVRVNGSDLKCKIVAEGGNLGFTQLGRVEYSLAGGMMNTDFVDNSGGVDCSDHEVNLKILLNGIVRENKLTEAKRNVFLASMTDDVAALVLKNNYHQTQAISFSRKRSVRSIDSYQRLIRDWEKEGKINRRLEYLPTDDILLIRKSSRLGMTKPEIAVLYAYAKNILKSDIIQSSLPEDSWCLGALESAFPRAITETYHAELLHHQLRREIIATQVSNEFINRLGINFLHRVVQQMGVTTVDVVRAYALSIRLFDVENLWLELDAVDATLPFEAQFEMREQLYLLMRRSVRWLLSHYRQGIQVEGVLQEYKPLLVNLLTLLPTHLKGTELNRLKIAAARYQMAGVKESLAHGIALSPALFFALDIVSAALRHNRPLESVTYIYFTVMHHLELDWLRDKIVAQPTENNWEESAKFCLLDDLDTAQHRICAAIICALPQQETESLSAESVLQQWLLQNQTLVKRFIQLLSEIKMAETQNFTMYSVMMRALAEIVQ